MMYHHEIVSCSIVKFEYHDIFCLIKMTESRHILLNKNDCV